jgi:potassium-transporting ATPase KdpC subunit
MSKILRPVIVSLFVFTVLTGILYPLAVTGIAQLFFPVQANGSVMFKDGKPAGCSLIGQTFDNPKYFWGRLSATSPFPYNSAASSGSNRAQTNPDLIKQVKDRISALREADPEASRQVPVDLVTASGSGLDPDISPAAADYQIRRVANARGLDEAKVRTLVKNYTKSRTLGILGEPRVNVFELNTALDGIK